MLTSYILQYKLIGFNLPLAENWLVALRFHVVFLMNARKWEPLTDCSKIDRQYDLIVTKKSVDLSHQKTILSWPQICYQTGVTSLRITHPAELKHHVAAYIWVNIGSGNTGGNGLLDDGTKSFLKQ